MSDRVILAVRFTPAGTDSQVRKAVGGFLRYVQHRDLHPNHPEGWPRPEVSGLLKYVAYRDRASTRAELFGPSGTLTSEDRKAFAAFVAGSLDKSSPQFFRGRDGKLHDRRRAVYRLVISPERADGLDLRRLTTSAVTRLERESGMTGLRWIAAIHRNTAHHHVHLVIAGMHQDESGGYRRVDITKQRLAAMKEGLSYEIHHQRADRIPSQSKPTGTAEKKAEVSSAAHETETPPRIALVQRTPAIRASRYERHGSRHSVTALRAVARRYQRRMQHELEESYRHSHLELAA